MRTVGKGGTIVSCQGEEPIAETMHRTCAKGVEILVQARCMRRVSHDVRCEEGVVGRLVEAYPLRSTISVGGSTPSEVVALTQSTFDKHRSIDVLLAQLRDHRLASISSHSSAQREVCTRASL